MKKEQIKERMNENEEKGGDEIDHNKTQLNT
jgi:hypothetical protein